MFFRARYIVRHWGIRDVPEPLHIEKPDHPRVALTLRSLRADEIKRFYALDDWVADLVTEQSITAKTCSHFSSPDSRPPHPATLEAARSASTRIHEFLSNFLRLARWRTGVFGHHNLIRCAEGGLEWSIDEVVWRSARLPGKAVLSVERSSTKYREELIEEVSELLLRDHKEPTGHELLREAWNLRQTSPRSALVLGLSALEVGVKAFVAEMVPDAEWLCFEAPTPPIVTILQDYLPRLPVRRTIAGKVVIPPAIIATIKKATHQRNRVAHRGEGVVYGESLNEILGGVQTALFLLDYFAGHDWALENIQSSTAAERTTNRKGLRKGTE